MKLRFFVVLVVGCLLLASCSDDGGDEITLGDTDIDLPVRPDTPGPTLYAPGGYLDGLARSLASDVNTPARDGDVFSDVTAFCYADTLLDKAKESELKDSGITNKNVTQDLDEVVQLDNRFEILANCMNTAEVADFFADNSRQSDVKILCAVEKIGVEKVRTDMINKDKQIQALIEAEAKNC